MYEKMTQVVNVQSMFLMSPRCTAAGSCGFGVIGGAETNSKKTVKSPIRMLPRDVSASLI